jgi:hypothetical protein
MATIRSGRHFERLSRVSTGPGTFVYDGSHEAVEYHPTAMKRGKTEPVLDDDGMPVLDDKGEQVYHKPGRFVIGSDGRPVLGGKPKEVRVKLESKTVFGVEFLAGKPVFVSNRDLAVKLRCLGGFTEVEGDAPETTEEAPKKRGRPRKEAVAETEPKNE